MKFLAIEREIDGADFENAQSILKDEAKHVLKLQNDDYIREIYFTEDHNAVLILECKDIEEAIKILNELPLVIRRVRMTRTTVCRALKHTITVLSSLAIRCTITRSDALYCHAL